MADPPRVLITRQLPDPAIERLRPYVEIVLDAADQPLTEDQLCERVAGCRGMVCLLTDRITRRVIEAGTDLEVIANVAVGFNNIDIDAATDKEVYVTHTPGVLTDTTADFGFAMLMATARRIPEADRFVRAGNFHGWELDMLLGVDVHHATLGVVGLGRIGGGVARRARRGFDMTVLYHDVQRQPELEQSDGFEYCELDDLLRRSDFVSVHVPLQPDTHHLIGARELGLMKPDAVLINTSRGPVVDEAALDEALANGTIRAAGLDVFEDEPQVHPALVDRPNVVLTPHIASASVATRYHMATMAAENLLAALRGDVPPQLVNRELAPT